MALQWMILTYVVAAEAAIALLLTLPSPKLIKDRLVSLISLILQPALFIVPFAGFQLLGGFFFLLSLFSLIIFCLRLLRIRILLWFAPVMAFQKLNRGLSHVWLMRKIGEFDF
jgi:hypothetical protein